MKLLRKELLTLEALLQKKGLDSVSTDTKYQSLLRNIHTFGGIDLSPPFFLNGLILNREIISSLNAPLHPRKSE